MDPFSICDGKALSGKKFQYLFFVKLKFQTVPSFETKVSSDETFVSTAGIFVSTADILVSTEENKKGEKRNYANTWNYNKKRKQSTKKIIDVELIPDGYGWDTGI